VKAVAVGEDGKEEIVGFAAWQTVVVKEGGVGIYGAGKGEVLGVVDEKREEVKTEDVKTVVNEKLCDDLFIPGDQFMARACEGRDYHSMSSCLVDDFTNLARTLCSCHSSAVSTKGYWVDAFGRWT